MRHKRLVMLTMLDNPLQLYTNDCAEAAALRRYLRLRHRRYPAPHYSIRFE